MQSFFDMVFGGSLLDSPLVQAAVRSLMLAAVVGAGLAAFRVRNAHHQLTAWTAVLLIAVMMPLLMRSVVISVPADPLPSAFIETPRDVAAAATTVDFDAAGEMTAAGAFESEDNKIDWMLAAAAVYGVVASLLMLRLIVGLVLTARLRGQAERLYTVWTGNSDVRVSRVIHAPVTVGDTILLPPDHESWPADKRRAVLLHERSHVSRGDFYVQVLAAAHRAVFWFSPMAWWLNDKIASLAEHASDAEAVEELDARADYAAVLLDFARAPAAARFRIAPLAVAMARPAVVRERIERVLSESGAVSRVRRGARAAIAALVLACGLGTAVSFVESPANAAAGIDVAPLPATTAAPEPPTMLVPPSPSVPPVPPVDVDTHGASVGGFPLRAWSPPVRVDIPAFTVPEINVDVDFDRDFQKDLDRAREIGERVQARIERTGRRAAQRAEAVAHRMKVADRAPAGPMMQETRDVGAFEGVSFGGSGKVFITIGPKTSVVLESDAETLKRTRTEVDDGVLRIRRRNGDDDFWDGRRSDIVVRITVPRLESARVSGSGDLKVTGLNGGETKLAVSGSGSVEADGRLQSLSLAISGSGDANMAGLVTNEANVAISGSGSAVIDVREDLNVRVSGSGSVRYLTQPKDVNTSISGSGSVRRRDAT